MSNTKIVFMRYDGQFLCMNDDYPDSYTTSVFDATGFTGMTKSDAEDLVGGQLGDFMCIDVSDYKMSMADKDKDGFFVGEE